MTTTSDVNSSQIRDYNKLFRWLTEQEAKYVDFFEEGPLADEFRDREDDSIEDRLTSIILTGTMHGLLKIQPDDGRSTVEYLMNVPYTELVMLASVQTELTFRKCDQDTRMENSYEIFALADYVPRVVAKIVQILGDVKVEEFTKFMFTPLKTFIEE